MEGWVGVSWFRTRRFLMVDITVLEPKLPISRQTSRSNYRGLDRVILPIVIRPDEHSITVAQLKGWIRQHGRYAHCGQTRTDAT